MDHAVSFEDMDSAQFVHTDKYQRVVYPAEYPAFIQIHREDPAQDVPLHWHPASELIYTRNRQLTVTIDGEKNVVEPGDFVLVSSYALHSVLPGPGEERQDVMSVTFQVEYLNRMYPGLDEIEISRSAPAAGETAREQLRSLCRQLREQVGSMPETEFGHFVTNQLLFAMLQLIYRDFLVGRSRGYAKQRDMRSKMVGILTYLQENYRDNLTTQSVADHFGYTREYFCRLFKRYFNQTMKEYLTELRLSKAAEQLRTTGSSCGQVAAEQGFPDEKSFFFSFKKKYGVTPAQYRNRKN